MNLVLKFGCLICLFVLPGCIGTISGPIAGTLGGGVDLSQRMYRNSDAHPIRKTSMMPVTFVVGTLYGLGVGAEMGLKYDFASLGDKRSILFTDFFTPVTWRNRHEDSKK